VNLRQGLEKFADKFDLRLMNDIEAFEAEFEDCLRTNLPRILGRLPMNLESNLQQTLQTKLAELP
jgi:hypothetical protein